MLHRLDKAFPVHSAERCKVVFRDDFFGQGYARSTPAADRAIAYADDKLGLLLDTTYSGKAMAALLHDAAAGALTGQTTVFWNTHNSRVLPVNAARPADVSALPAEFLRYYD